MEQLRRVGFLLVSSLCITLPLSGCGDDDENEEDIACSSFPGGATVQVCSSLNGQKTENCVVEEKEDGSRVLNYQLVSSRECVKIPVEGGNKADITMHDAMVYNKTLLPERLELGQGDELRINYKNELTMPNDPERFTEVKEAAKEHRMKGPWVSNLHTHGLVTPWDFKDNQDVRGDNVLGVLLSSEEQDVPEGVDPKSWCSTTGVRATYSYPIRGDHEIGLNWYHPHPHGLTGFQVEGGMSGMLMIGDATAEKVLHPTYLQLKDMQASKRDDGSYQFEKFAPPVAGVCYSKEKDEEEGWDFDGDEPGRCNYHNINDSTQYSWLFMVNGEVFPTINVPKSAYLRISNSSANATYRLLLEPNTVKTQEPNTSKTYYVPPFKVIEKDGMTTTEIAKTNTLESCTVAMTPATRAGLSLDFDAAEHGDSICELTVTIKQEQNGNIEKLYDVKRIQLDADKKALVEQQAKPDAYVLTQGGIDTGEDDWPAVKLATLVPDETLPKADLAAYQKALAEKPTVQVAERTDVKPPIDSCTPEIPAADGDGINRHVVLFFGATGIGSDAEAEHFGLVAAGEKNLGAPVTIDTIQAWRKEYLRQFPTMIENSETPSAGGTHINVQGYGMPNLEAAALDGLVTHKFRINEDDSVDSNICTQQSNRPERWRIHNLSAQIHNFHIHQLKFKVLNVRGSACMLPTKTTDLKAFELVDKNTGYLNSDVTTDMLAGAMDEQCIKSYAELFHNVPASFKVEEVPQLPPGTESREAFTTAAVAQAVKKHDYGRHDTFPVPPMGYIDIELTLNKPENVGEYVFHCHILEHEDAGMMGKLVVHPKQ